MFDLVIALLFSCHCEQVKKINNYFVISWSIPIARGRTYVMITYVSKENNIGPDAKIRYIWGLKGPMFIL